MICVRYNKTRGQAGRGSIDHVWRIFDDGKEYVVKNVRINVPSWGAKTGEDWSICCEGIIAVDKETSTITIGEKVCMPK
jgi:uncharacterized protein CbrC (UPF0167 family)